MNMIRDKTREIDGLSELKGPPLPHSPSRTSRSTVALSVVVKCLARLKNREVFYISGPAKRWILNPGWFFVFLCVLYVFETFDKSRGEKKILWVLPINNNHSEETSTKNMYFRNIFFIKSHKITSNLCNLVIKAIRTAYLPQFPIAIVVLFYKSIIIIYVLTSINFSLKRS